MTNLEKRNKIKNHFYTLYGYELKKICKRKMVWITMVVVILLAFFTGCADIFSIMSVSDGKETITMSGLEYQRYKKENKVKLNGKAIDDTLLNEVREAYQGIHMISYDEQEGAAGNGASRTMSGGSFDDDEEKMKELAQKREEYEVIYHYITDSTGNYEAVHWIDEKGLYQARLAHLVKKWNEQGLSQMEKEYWIKKENELVKPFVYQYAEGWERVIGAMYSLCFMMGITIAICLANVFSEEHVRKTDQLILSSRYGKKSCFLAKIAAGVTFGVVSGGISFLVTTITILILYGAEGKDAAIQILFPSCSQDRTVGQVVIMFAMVYFIVCLLWSILTLFLSEATKNGVAVTGIMSGGLFVAMILEIPDFYRILSQIWELVPVRLMAIWQLGDNRLVKILGIYLNNFEAATLLYLLICVLLVFWGKYIYQKFQVKGR